MWIFLNNAFLSIVDKGSTGSTLLVRARRQGDIEQIVPEAQVRETPQNDYRFRAHIEREQIALAMAEAVRTITYPNFKSSIQENNRHDAYLGVWRVMHNYQGSN